MSVRPGATAQQTRLLKKDLDADRYCQKQIVDLQLLQPAPKTIQQKVRRFCAVIWGARRANRAKQCEAARAAPVYTLRRSAKFAAEGKKDGESNSQTLMGLKPRATQIDRIHDAFVLPLRNSDAPTPGAGPT